MMRRRLVRTALAAVVVLGAATAAALWTKRDDLGAVAGYAAKRYAVGVFLQGRDEASLAAEEFAPESSLERAAFPFLSVDVDRAARRVRASLFGVARVAAWDDREGSVLLDEAAAAIASRGAARADPDAETPAEAAARAARPWPLGDRDAEGPREGLDGAALDAAVAAAFTEPSAGPKRRTRAVLVARGGRIVAERYAAGFGPSTPLAGWSMSKSVVAALVGLRVDAGRLALDAPLPWPSRDAGDPRAAITLRDVLRMSSGLRWTENYADPAGDPVRMLYAERDTAAFVAARPLEEAPGTSFRYSSGSTNLLCGVLRATQGDDGDLGAWARRALFRRLGMASVVFERDPSGGLVGSSFVFATARDWLRFGLLYAGRGVFAGERVLSEAWIAACLETAPAAPRGEYGLHWWLNRGPGGDAGRRPHPRLPADVFMADGFEGQTVLIAPSHDAVVVRLGLSKTPGAWDADAFFAAVLAALPPAR